MAAYHRTVPPRTIIPDVKKSLNHQKDDNLIIHGDNLHALKALLPKYAGRVNCIYIDPPYNTGNEGWVYNDNVSSPILKAWLGDMVGSDDMERHSKWCCMMWPRLQMLRELLAEDGVIFVSIDDNEQHHLRMMMDEIFGAENFVANVIWWSKYTLSNDSKTISYQHENILSYAKDMAVCKIGILPRTEEMNKAYRNPDDDPKGVWKSTPLHAKSGTEKSRYSIIFPNGITWKCPDGRYPRYTKQRLIELYENGELWFGKNGALQPSKKSYLSEVKSGKTVGSLWSYKDVGSTHEANEDLASIMGKGVFENPKNKRLIQRIIRTANLSSGGIVLDSFAGSGTTAHAVLELNKEDGGSRKFILVECEDYADRITAERVRRVIRGTPDAKDKSLRDGTGGTFTYCTLGKAIDAEKMLGNEDFPDYSTLAAYLLYLNGTTTSDKLRPNRQGMFYQADDTDYYLMYTPNQKFMMSSKARLGTKQALDIANRGRRAVVFAADSEMGENDLRQLKIELVRLPYVLETAR